MNDPWSRDPLADIDLDDLDDAELYEAGCDPRYWTIQTFDDVQYFEEWPRRNMRARDLHEFVRDLADMGVALKPWLVELPIQSGQRMALAYLDDYSDVPHIAARFPLSVRGTIL